MQQPVNHNSLTRTIKRYIASASAAVMIAMLIMTSSPGLYARAAEQPTAVSDFSIKVSSSPAATLTWNKVDCDGYKVCRDKRVIARVKPGTSGSQVTFVDESIEPGKSYTYSVKAYRNEGGKESCSSPAAPVRIHRAGHQTCHPGYPGRQKSDRDRGRLFQRKSLARASVCP